MERSTLQTLLTYVKKHSEGVQGFDPIPVIDVNGGGSGTGASAGTIAAGIDSSVDIDTLINLLTSIRDTPKPTAVTATVPLTGISTVNLPAYGYFKGTVTGLNGNFLIQNTLVNYPNYSKNNLVEGSEFYFWANSSTLTLASGTNTAPATVVFQSLDELPSLPEFVFSVNLAANTVSDPFSSLGYGCLIVDRNDVVVEEFDSSGGSVFTKRYNNIVTLSGTSFTIGNVDSIAKNYTLRLRKDLIEVATAAVLDSSTKSEGSASGNRIVVAGVNSSNEAKALTLSNDSRLLTTDLNTSGILNLATSLDQKTPALGVATAAQSVPIVYPSDRPALATENTSQLSASHLSQLYSPLNNTVFQIIRANVTTSITQFISTGNTTLSAIRALTTANTVFYIAIGVGSYVSGTGAAEYAMRINGNYYANESLKDWGNTPLPILAEAGQNIWIVKASSIDPVVTSNVVGLHAEIFYTP